MQKTAHNTCRSSRKIDVLDVTSITDERDFSCQTQYLPTSELTPVAPNHVTDVGEYVTSMDSETHFWWPTQCLVRLEGDLRCSLQGKTLHMSRRSIVKAIYRAMYKLW